MSIFSNNIKLLRGQHGLSQQALADKLLISRANLSKYEGAIHEPSYDVLIRISRYYSVTIDMLLTIDMREMDRAEVEKMKGNKVIFPVQVDTEGNDVIEVVPHNAQAGYSGMYSDVGFIESLDHMELPFLRHQGKCRAFPINGDSMPPFGDGSFVIGRFISDRGEVKKGKRYILLSRDEGIMFKRVQLDDIDTDKIILHSDNPKYEPFEMNWNEIIEIWEFTAAVTQEESSGEDAFTEMLSRIRNLQDDLKEFSQRFI